MSYRVYVKLDFPELITMGRQARMKVLSYPQWEQDAIRCISEAACSTESRIILYTTDGVIKREGA